MIYEHALLDIVAGESARFEREFTTAAPYVVAADGARQVRLLRCVEESERYLLLVAWDDVDAHLRFRASPGYEQWRRRIHPLLGERPTVQHYEIVAVADEP